MARPLIRAILWNSFPEKKRSKHSAIISPWWSPILIKSQDADRSKIPHFSWTFSISSGHSFCRARANAIVCSLDVFLGSLIKRQTSDISSDNKWQRVNWMATSDNESNNKWQQMTASDNESHLMTTSDRFS